jgi:hypothetical protein
MLTDLLTRNLDLVICGTGVGSRSAELGQYYAGPRNRFWRTLAQVGSDARGTDARSVRTSSVIPNRPDGSREARLRERSCPSLHTRRRLGFEDQGDASPASVSLLQRKAGCARVKGSISRWFERSSGRRARVQLWNKAWAAPRLAHHLRSAPWAISTSTIQVSEVKL